MKRFYSQIILKKKKQSILKKNKAGKLTWPEFKTYYKPTG